MELDIKILGIGIERLFWDRFCHQIHQRLAGESIRPIFDYFGYTWSNFQERGLECLKTHEPDLLIISTSLFGKLEEFESLLEEYRAYNTFGYPTIFLVEKNPERFIKNCLALYPLAWFKFKRLPKTRLTASEFFAPFKKDNVKRFEITPPPVFELVVKTQNRFAPDNQFIPFTKIKTISWKGKAYTPRQFVQSQSLRQTLGRKRTPYTGFLIERKRTYLDTGLRIAELVEIEAGEISIDHVLSYDQARRNSENYAVFLSKCIETIKYRAVEAFGQRMLSDSHNLKSNIPLSIHSELPIIDQAFSLILKKDGYSKTEIADQSSDQNQRFVVSLKRKPVEKSVLDCSLPLNDDVFDIPRLPSLSVDFFTTAFLADDPCDLFAIRKQRERIEKRIEQIENQIGDLNGSRALNDQKRYLNAVSKEKLEIILSLMEIAETWNDQNCEVVVAGREKVLVFYAEQSEASRISEQLEGKHTPVFVDISKETATLERLVIFSTIELEPFLHSNVVFCTPTSKSLFAKRFQKFHHSVEKATYPPIDESIQKLEGELQEQSDRLIGLSYLELYRELEKLYRQYRETLLSKGAKAFSYLEKERYRPHRIKKICIVSENKVVRQNIQSVFSRFYPDLDEERFSYITTVLELDNTVSKDRVSQLIKAQPEGINIRLAQEVELAKTNAKKIAAFFRSVLKELNRFSPDLLILENDFDLLYLLIRILKQENSTLNSTPIIALFQGRVNVKKMSELTRKDVKLIYQDQNRNGDVDFLSKSIRTNLFVN